MTFRFYSLLCVMTLSLLATMGSAQAVTYIADDVSGIWTSADPASAASGLGTNEIRWGTPATSHGQSGYRFDNATPPPVVGNVGDTFVLGTFTHMNWPITGTAITSAELSVSFDLTIDGVIFNDRVFSYMFEHEETPNSLPDPRDIVTFVGASAEQTVFANGKNYTV
ncbi:MAG: choice-of-anchor K domain-containing protein [Chlamydiia bacterium]|nr:choice-of-anchor K domain-containing protein [Chlamydiia bacterium]